MRRRPWRWRFHHGGRSGGATLGDHSRPSGGDTSRRSGVVRRGNGRCGRGFGGGGGKSNAGAEVAATAAAEELLELAEYDAETEDAAEASEAEAARGQPPRPSNWVSMSKNQKKTWRKHGRRPRSAQGHGGKLVPPRDPPCYKRGVGIIGSSRENNKAQWLKGPYYQVII